MNRETLLELIPEYALDVLSEEEKRAVEALLATDSEAQALLADYQAITDIFALTAEARLAPPHLRNDLKARLAAEKPSLTILPKPSLETAISPQTSKQRIPIWFMSAAAALVVLAVGVLIALNLLNPTPNQAELLFNELAQLPDSQRIPIESVFKDDMSGELIIAPDGQRAALKVANLPVVNEPHDFQLWLVSPDGVQSGGIIPAIQAAGTSYITIPLAGTSASDYQAFGVSLEPEGGSPFADRPSGERMFFVNLPEAS